MAIDNRRKPDPRVDTATDLRPLIDDDDMVECETGSHMIKQSSIIEHRRTRQTVPSFNEISPDDALLRLLLTLQLKLESRALNGGFDSLEEKVDSIKTGQQETQSDIKEIKTALYDPNDGLFSKVRDTNDYVVKTKTEMMTDIEDVKKWKRKITTVVIWIVGGIGTGALGLIGKTIWQWFSGHVTVN